MDIAGGVPLFAITFYGSGFVASVWHVMPKAWRAALPFRTEAVLGVAETDNDAFRREKRTKPRVTVGGGSPTRILEKRMDENEFASVVQQARQRDPQALTALCNRFYPKMLKYMRYRVAPDDASDLTGEVFVRMIRSIDRQNGVFVAWLFKIAACAVADHFRTIGKRREVLMNEQVAISLHNADCPAQTVGRKMDLEDAVEQLTDDQRQLLALKFTQGLSTNEAAEIMDRSAGAIRVLQFRALSTLREILGGSGGVA